MLQLIGVLLVVEIVCFILYMTVWQGNPILLDIILVVSSFGIVLIIEYSRTPLCYRNSPSEPEDQFLVNEV
jgi:hypothetical protein